MLILLLLLLLLLLLPILPWSYIIVMENIFLGLFPNPNPLDTAARDALSYNAQQTFVYLDNLRKNAQDENVAAARKTYARLILSYDRFLKAGDLYPTYDPITSTAVFFKDQDQLRYNKKEMPKYGDRVLLISGPDMVSPKIRKYLLPSFSHFFQYSFM